MPEIIAMARRIAAESPGATLGCPICGIALTAANLDRHLDKVHPGQDDAGTSWRGEPFKGGRLTWAEAQLHWRATFGLRHRALSQIASVGIGSTAVSWLGSTRTYDTGDGHGPSPAEKPGTYLQLRGAGDPFTIRCRSGAGVRKAWTGWEAGPEVTSWQITVHPDAFAALLYLLCEAGVLRPKGV